jgi:glutathione-regulated potassium-efflux system ancillary protein KefG
MSQHDRTLILLAHPTLSTSRVNTALADAITDLAHVTVRNLAQVRTRTGYDAVVEQHLVAEHDRIVMQFPWYWYAMPGLLKAQRSASPGTSGELVRQSGW